MLELVDRINLRLIDVKSWTFKSFFGYKHPIVGIKTYVIYLNADEQKSELEPKLKNKVLEKLNPYFVSEFADAESSFGISIIKNTKWCFLPSFEITLNKNDVNLLYRIQSFFGVGNVKKDIKYNKVTYNVSSKI